MAHHTELPVSSPEPAVAQADELQQCLLAICAPSPIQEGLKHPRGCPVKLTLPHLALGVLLCLLRGWESQLDLWRCLRFEEIGCLPRLDICDQTVYTRLGAQGIQAMQACFTQVSQWVVLPLMTVDNSDFSPSRLTAYSDSPYDKETIPATHFKQRGFVCPFMCSCSCLWFVSCSLWRGSGVLTGSIFGLPPHEEGPNAARSTVCSSPAAQTIAPPVVSAPIPRRVLGQLLLLCVPGLK